MKTALLIISAVIAIQSSAQGIIDPATRLMLKHNINYTHYTDNTQDTDNTQATSRGDTDYTEDPQSPFIPMMIEIDSDAAVSALETLGVTVYHRRGNILLTAVPREIIDEVKSVEGIVYMSAAAGIDRCLDMARPFGHADQVQTGQTPLTHGYDGTGVVVGFSDTGFYARHIAFDGRIRAIHDYDIANGTISQAVTPEQIDQWVTDNDEETHATHVANILTGAYQGNGYYGVATGADIVATTSRLSDVGILCGVEDIIDYARSVDKPCVINLSLSNFLGPHDGTDLFCRYIADCAKDAIICISAGNYGQREIFATGILSDDSDDVCVKISEKIHWTNFTINGYMDIWSEDSTPFRYRFAIYDGNTNTRLYATDWTGGVSESTSYTLDTTDPVFAEYFTGAVATEAEISPLNGRYEAVVYVQTKTEAISDAGPWARYRLVLEVAHADDTPTTRVDIFSDGGHINLGNVSGKPNCVSYAGSISDLCTADGVISIGMAESRLAAPALSGDPFEWTGTIGTICPHSSYSDTPGIKKLPHFSAPGYWVVSAMSTPYLEKHPDTRVSAVSEVDGVNYYWYPECGTSMASPYAAGVIATWLQANPDLTSEQIIDIVRATAITDYPDISDPRWGAGEIDAFAGLQKVITDSSTSSIELVTPLITVDGNGTLQITFPGGKALPYSIHTLSGVTLTHDTALLPGIYIVSIQGQAPRKILIK